MSAFSVWFAVADTLESELAIVLERIGLETTFDRRRQTRRRNNNSSQVSLCAGEWEDLARDFEQITRVGEPYWVQWFAHVL